MWKYYEWFPEVLWLPRNSFIVRFTESVDRQVSGMCGWARVTRILCAKHKNASWAFSLGDFLLESLFCAQSSWSLNLFSHLYFDRVIRPSSGWMGVTCITHHYYVIMNKFENLHALQRKINTRALFSDARPSRPILAVKEITYIQALRLNTV